LARLPVLPILHSRRRGFQLFAWLHVPDNGQFCSRIAVALGPAEVGAM
jgi:hypothetical protein